MPSFKSVLNFDLNPMGRISRKEFWLFYIMPLMLLIFVSMGFLVNSTLFMSGDPQILAGVISSKIVLWAPFLVLYVWTAIAIILKRCHDRGHSGFWFFLPFLIMSSIHLIVGYTPLSTFSFDGFEVALSLLLSLIAVFVMLYIFWITVNLYFLRGTIGSNKYGPYPLERN